MNVLTTLVLSAVLAAGEPGPAEGAQPTSPDGAAAKSKSPGTQPPAKKSSTSGSLDDDLFGDLTGELFQGLDKPKLGTQPAIPGKQPAKATSDSKQPGAKQPPQPPPDRKSPDKPPTGNANPPDPADEFGPGEDLGQESSPLLDLGQRMRRVESRRREPACNSERNLTKRG